MMTTYRPTLTVTVLIYSNVYRPGHAISFGFRNSSPVQAMAAAYEEATALSPTRVANVIDWRWL
jgi:hypothetical protein